MYRQSLEITLLIGDQQGTAIIYSNLGIVHSELGNYEAAIQMHQKALEIEECIGDEPGAAQTNDNLAAVYQVMGEVGQALAYYHKSLAIKERIGDRHGAAPTLTSNWASSTASRGTWPRPAPITKRPRPCTRWWGMRVMRNRRRRRCGGCRRAVSGFGEQMERILAAVG
jgi:tetratricopeptide (TPR) repeat protein